MSGMHFAAMEMWLQVMKPCHLRSTNFLNEQYTMRTMMSQGDTSKGSTREERHDIRKLERHTQQSENEPNNTGH